VLPGDRLLLYCDGLVEQMQNEDVASFVYKELKEVKDKKDLDPAKILVKLIDLSLEKGSKDNMSALMVLFEDGTDYDRKKAEFIAGPFNPYKNDDSFRNAYLADAKRFGYEGDELMAMAKKTEETLGKTVTPIPADSGGPNITLKSLIHSLASNLGGLPGENREEKAMALMALLQGGAYVDDDSDKNQSSQSQLPGSPASRDETRTSGSGFGGGGIPSPSDSDRNLFDMTVPSPTSSGSSSSSSSKKKKKKKKKKSSSNQGSASIV